MASMNASSYDVLKEVGIDAIVKNEGFSTLWTCAEPEADIVFIHGLQGHPVKTWYCSHYGDAGRSKSSLSRLWKGPEEDSKGCFWPKDVLPKHFPTCRILTYGYDSHISHFFTGTANQTSIGGHAKSLLNDLEAIRQEERTRPIVFIVHSLGGLLLKEALRQSWQSDEDEEEGIHLIYESTIATFFLGTPHRGSDLADWGLMMQRAVKAVRFDTSDVLLKDLRVESTTLETLTDGFARVYEKQRFQIFTFREGRALSIPIFSRGKVVKDVSATLGYARENVDTINADHRNMCRFAGKNDPGFVKIRNALNKSMKALPGGIEGIKFRTALAELDSAETRWRFQQVEPAFKGTFEWLFNDRRLGFNEWLHSDAGLYWIKGKPASGKSTLLKMAYKDARTHDSQLELKRKGYRCTTPAFFFHDRGSPIQKSLEGLLKAILHKILTDIPELKPIVHEAWRGLLLRKTQSFAWTVESLITVLEKVIQQNILDMSILLFVDALDEYDGRYQDIVQFLNRVFRASTRSRRTKVKICATSRPEQIFLDNFSDVPGFWIHDHTAGDIARIVDVEFDANARLRNILKSGTDEEKLPIHQFRAKMLSLAEGVFLWVRLILEELLTEFTDGASLEEIHDELLNLPTDLTLYYKYLVEKRIRQKYSNETRVMFELLKCAIRPLVLSDFLLAFRFATLRDLGSRSVRINTTLDEAKRLIGSRCGGLVQIREFVPADVSMTEFEKTLIIDGEPDDDEMGRIYDKVPPSSQSLSCYQVQFLHQTVKTFAEKSPTMTLKAQGPDETGYLYLAKLCLLAIRDSAFDTKKLLFQTDFIRYLRLTEAATGQSLSPYLSQVEPSKVVGAVRSLTSTHYLPSPSDYSELAILAQLSLLLRERLETESAEKVSQLFELFCKCLQRAWHKFPSHIAHLLLQHEAHEPLVWKAVGSFLATTSGEAQVSSFRDSRLELVRIVLDSGADPNTPFLPRDDDGDGSKASPSARRRRQRPPPWTRMLHAAVQCQDPQHVVESLLGRGAEINALDGEGRTPLDLAVRRYLSRFDVLLSMGKDNVAARDAYLSRFSVAQYLLEHGARLSEPFRRTCAWEASGESLQSVGLLSVPTDARLPFPPAMARRRVVECEPEGDPAGVSAHSTNNCSSGDAGQAQGGGQSWLTYTTGQVYTAVSWMYGMYASKAT